MKINEKKTNLDIDIDPRQDRLTRKQIARNVARSETSKPKEISKQDIIEMREDN